MSSDLQRSLFQKPLLVSMISGDHCLPEQGLSAGTQPASHHEDGWVDMLGTVWPRGDFNWIQVA